MTKKTRFSKRPPRRCIAHRGGTAIRLKQRPGTYIHMVICTYIRSPSVFAWFPRPLPAPCPYIRAPPAATQFSVVRAPPVATLVSSFHFVSSYLWAPPVASQFSVLSQTFVKVRAPPVATLLFHLISSHHFSWHRLWRHSFLLFGHRKWRPSDRQTDRQADPCKKHILFSSFPSSCSDYYKFLSSLFCLLCMFFLCVSWLGLKTPGKL